MDLHYTYYTTKELTKRTGMDRRLLHQKIHADRDRPAVMAHVKTLDGHVLIPSWAFEHRSYDPEAERDWIYTLTPPTEHAQRELDYLAQCMTTIGLKNQLGKTWKEINSLIARAGITPIELPRGDLKPYQLIHKDDLAKLPRKRERGEKEPVEQSTWSKDLRISPAGYARLQTQRDALLKEYDIEPVEANSAIVSAGLDIAANGVKPEQIAAWRDGYKEVAPFVAKGTGNRKQHRGQLVRITLPIDRVQRFEDVRTRYHLSMARTVDLSIYLAGLTDNHISGMIAE